MASSDANPNRPDRERARRLGIRLSISSLVSAIFLSIAAIGLAYIGGVMSGRHVGARPEATREISSGRPEAASETPQAGILSPEELEFARVLRNVPAPKDNSQAVKTEPDPPVPQARHGEPVTEEVNTPSGEERNSRAFLEAGLAPPSPEGMNDYVFQMGAFKDEAGADKLREILEGHGLRTRMRRSGRMFLVLALVRGNAQRAAEIISLARDLRLGSPLELERKPVPRSRNR